MSTVATSRPALSALGSGRAGSPVAAAVAPPPPTSTPTFAIFRHSMHSDNLLLTKHGVPSPRLDLDTQDPKGRESEEDHVMVEDEEEQDEDVDADAGSRASRKDLEDDRDEGDEADAVSLCSSEDSELSVGQEDPLDGSRAAAKLAPSLQQTRRLLLSNVSDMMSLCRPSAFSNVAAPASAPVPVQEAGDTHSADDAPPSPGAGRVLDPFAVASALRMPVPVVPRHGVGAQLQEELLRKSHLYAEELMKHQMQLMAAARASAFTLRHAGMAPASPHSPLEATKLGFRPQQPHPHPQPPPHSHPHPLAHPQTKAADLPHYSGIQSHLSAISKMSQLSAAAAAAAAAAVVHNQQQPTGPCGPGSDALAKLTALGMGHAHTPMQTQTQAAASNLNQLQAQMQAHLPFMNNNNLNEPALKFSIDNILKADFGRRITDPLLKRSGSGGAAGAGVGGGSNGTRAARLATAQRHKKSPAAGASAPPTPMDLTSQMTAAAAGVTAASSSFSTTLANICTNSNDSSSTAVSSNYGTSEALKSPSSLTGGASACSVSPAPPGGDGAKTGQENPEGGGSSSSSSSSTSNGGGGGTGASGNGPIVWPAWVYCTRYSDRPSSGRSPRARKPKKPASEKGVAPPVAEDKRPRTAFSGSQLARLKHEFTENRYLTEKRRQQLSAELGLNEAQIKIWFQNKRAKLKKSSGTKNPLALQLMAQGLYNHSTVPLTREEEELQELQERENAAAAAAADNASS